MDRYLSSFFVGSGGKKPWEKTLTFKGFRETCFLQAAICSPILQNMNSYMIHRVPQSQMSPHPLSTGISTFFRGTDWDSPPWNAAADLAIPFFHPRSESTHPQTRGKVLYDNSFLYWSFMVNDRWVRAAHLAYQDPVCKDSCVEFFAQPARGKGYFNFEVNCIGTMQVLYIEDPTRTETGFQKATPVSVSDAADIQIWTSIRERPYLPENQDPLEWRMDAIVPFDLFRKYIPGFNPPGPGAEWRGNFYKCADNSSHPHWASWAPIGDELNFHVPQYFGTLGFV
jgi:hypothetical protein